MGRPTGLGQFEQVLRRTQSSASSLVGTSLAGQATAAISTTASGMPTHSSTSVVVKPSALRSTRTAPTSTIQTRETGISTFQPIDMNWS